MFQKFYEDTLIGRFIKRLIRSTNLPILSIIQHNDYVVEDCYYIHSGYIVHALTSGKFCVSPDKHFGIGTYYTDLPGVTETGVDGKIKRASYEVIDKYDEENKQHSYNFHSRFMYYDPETHYHLGEYLRYLRDTSGLNLFPYYNCFSGSSISDVKLNSGSSNTPIVTSSDNQHHKILLTPVKYSKTYTVALECNTPVIIQPIIYNSNAGLIITDYTRVHSPTYYSESFSKILKPSSRFIEPFTVTIPDAPDKQFYQQERNLYLAIQVPVDLPTGLVVLEGDYTLSWSRTPQARVLRSFDSSCVKYGDTLDDLYVQNPTLLHFDSKTNIAFSNRLIEYLLLAVINDTETLDGNIRYLQNVLQKITGAPSYSTSGVWDDRMRQQIYLWTNDSRSTRQYLLRDLDGFLNKDIEKMLSTLCSKEN